MATNMTNPSYSEADIIDVATDAGRLLLLGGAESFRIEETVEHIGQSLGLPLTCYVTLTAVIVSANNGVQTKLVKACISGFNLRTVDHVNTLSRSLVAGQITPEEFYAGIKTLKQQVVDFPLALKVFSAGLVGMAPSLIAKGTPLDYVIMFFAGVIGYLAYILTDKKSKTPYAPEFIGGLAIGLFVLMCHGLFPEISTFSAILGAVMPLVPGLAMTNAIREIIMGDVLSGLVRAITALLVVSSLVAGVWIAFELVRFV